MSATILGLALGAIYGVSALGIVTVYRGSRVINFAHGGIAVWAAWAYVELRESHGLGGVPAGAMTTVGAAAFGTVVFLGVFRRIRHASELMKLIMSLGLLVALLGFAINEMGTSTRPVASSLPAEPIEVFGANVGRDRLWILGIALLVAGVMAVWTRFARTALASFAMERNEEATVALGYSPTKLGAVNWAIGSALAALSGVLIVPIAGLGVRTITIVLVPTLVAALFGKFERFGLAILGALILGVSGTHASRLVDIPGASSAVPLMVALVVLLLRRDRTTNRLPSQTAPAVGAGHVQWRYALPIAGAALAASQLGPTGMQDGLITTFASALFVLSLVVLIGYANQISLAQLAIAGVGLLVSARLNIAYGLPFEVAPLVGAVTGAALGTIVGLPALRVRGIYLGIVSLALAVAIESVLFENVSLTGGYDGLRPGEPAVFGIEVDALRYPGRYAAVCLVWLLAGTACVIALRRSSLGRRFLAVRTNERAAAAQGIDVARTKLLAFAASSALAGASGVLLGMRSRTVTFTQFGWFDSAELIAIAIMAGIGTVAGALLAGVLAPAGLAFYFVGDFGFVHDNAPILFGLGTMFAVLVHPNGLAAPHRRNEAGERLRPAASTDIREKAVLKVEGLTVQFGGVTAVHAFDLEVAPSEVVGLIGPNGSGKTTVLDAISGFAQAGAGSIWLGDVTLDHRNAAQRSRLGVGRVFQSRELFDDLTVADNLRLQDPTSSREPADLTSVAYRFLERTGALESADCLPSELSLGRRSDVAVARALALDPMIVLLDEPAAGLSARERLALVENIREIATYGVGVLLVEHDIELVQRVCDRVVVIVDGTNFAAGSPMEIARDPQVRRIYLGEESQSDDTVTTTDALANGARQTRDEVLFERAEGAR